VGAADFGRSWLDASQVLGHESWPADQQPRCVGYFVTVAPDDPGQPKGTAPDYPRQQVAQVRANAKAWLTEDARVLWPRLMTGDAPSAVDWNVLVDLRGQRGEARFDAQYFRINIESSQRFVLSVAKSTEYRLRTHESDVCDLYLTGDWIRNGFNCGNVESTVTSGLQCSRAISGFPQTIAGEHFMRIGPAGSTTPGQDGP
jgi:uncharacterized protein with NAD-binding domain and iron-sulfur cluster